MLQEHEKRSLLQLARQAVAASFGLAPPTREEPFLSGLPVGGVFVTLYQANCLRGCVGAFLETRDLGWLVREAAIGAIGDHRFAGQVIVAEDLPAIVLEISLLSKLELMAESSRLIPGVHGIRVEAFGRSGCFLPKVATQFQWSALQLLEACCTMKMGLPADAWRRPEANVQIFTADVFRDECARGS